MKNPVLIFACVIGLTIPAFSQDEPVDPSLRPDREEAPQQSDEPGAAGYWEAKLAGGEYVVALDRISSVSRHKYVLDGAVIVDEVTVDTIGQALARFYYISPITSGVSGVASGKVVERALDMVGESARAAGSDIQDMVVKKYPLTTHSKTIEYRLFTEAQLDMLYQSAKTAWQSKRGRVFTGL